MEEQVVHSNRGTVERDGRMKRCEKVTTEWSGIEMGQTSNRHTHAHKVKEQVNRRTKRKRNPPKRDNK